MKNPKKVFVMIITGAILCAVAALLSWILQVQNDQCKTPENTQTTQVTENVIMKPFIPDDTPRPVIDLDDGNEIYFDSDVIACLTEMEAEGEEEEDLVNAILDGEIQLINHFAKQGYRRRAICQAQRFYYDYYETLQAAPIETVIQKLTLFIPPNGAILDGFSETVQAVFGWGENFDYSYVIDVEVDE